MEEQYSEDIVTQWKKMLIIFSDGFRRADTSGGILAVLGKTSKVRASYRLPAEERGWVLQDFCDKNTAACAFSYFWNLGKRCKYAISADGGKTARQSTEAYPRRIFPFQCADDCDL